jgi:hypothetical protein
MTLPAIEHLEAMVANATKGPWASDVMCNVWGQAAGSHGKIANLSDRPQAESYDKIPADAVRANAALIALAPTLATQRIADAKRIAELEAAQVTVQEAAKVLLDALDAHNFDVVVGACFGDEAASRVMQDSRPTVFARAMLTATINYLDPSLDYLRAGADAKVATP